MYNIQFKEAELKGEMAILNKIFKNSNIQGALKKTIDI